MKPTLSNHQHPVWTVSVSTSAHHFGGAHQHVKPLSEIKGDIYTKEQKGNGSFGSGNYSRFSGTDVKGHTTHLELWAEDKLEEFHKEKPAQRQPAAACYIFRMPITCF